MKDYSGDEKRVQQNNGLRILIDLHSSMRGELTELARSVGRANSKITANYVKLTAIEKYNKDCNERLGEVEEWKAGHIGYGKGAAGSHAKSVTKITFLAGLAVAVFTIAGVIYSFLPQLNETMIKGIVAEVVKESLLK